MCGVWRYDVAGVGGGEFALRLVSRQRVAPPYWRSDTHAHTGGTTPTSAGAGRGHGKPVIFMYDAQVLQSKPSRPTLPVAIQSLMPHIKLQLGPVLNDSWKPSI
jgi:hypothetical protein